MQITQHAIYQTADKGNAAEPGKLAVLGAGDGGFLMSISDLETAIRRAVIGSGSPAR